MTLSTAPEIQSAGAHSEPRHLRRPDGGRAARSRSSTPPSCAGAAIDSVYKLDPRVQLKQPGHVRGRRRRVITTVEFVRRPLRAGLGARSLLHRSGRALALVHRPLRQLRRGDGRGARQGPGRHPAPDAYRCPGEAACFPTDSTQIVSATELRRGDLVLVEAGDLIPGDGEVVEGVASVNEAAITGESAPVIKEPGTDIRSSVTGGTTIVSDWLMIRITANPGETFLDRMIALVEGANRQKTPNEIALNILLASLTIIFLLVVFTLQPFAIYSGSLVAVTTLVALLVCLIPTTIGGLLSAIGIAGMDRLVQFNVLAMSGRAVEAAGDVDTLLLDKTGTITFGNRMAYEFIPVGGHTRGGADRGGAALQPGRRDARGQEHRGAGRAEGQRTSSAAFLDRAELVPFTAETRMSGVQTATAIRS